MRTPAIGTPAPIFGPRRARPRRLRSGPGRVPTRTERLGHVLGRAIFAVLAGLTLLTASAQAAVHAFGGNASWASLGPQDCVGMVLDVSPAIVSVEQFAIEVASTAPVQPADAVLRWYIYEQQTYAPYDWTAMWTEETPASAGAGPVWETTTPAIGHPIDPTKRTAFVLCWEFPAGSASPTMRVAEDASVPAQQWLYGDPSVGGRIGDVSTPFGPRLNPVETLFVASAGYHFELTLVADYDGDGWDDAPGNDCNDLNAAVNPGATEICNGIDDDCDGLIDDADPDMDLDGDGYGACVDDCDDMDPAVHPGASEVCNGTDDDCDGVIDYQYDFEDPGPHHATVSGAGPVLSRNGDASTASSLANQFIRLVEDNSTSVLRNSSLLLDEAFAIDPSWGANHDLCIEFDFRYFDRIPLTGIPWWSPGTHPGEGFTVGLFNGDDVSVNAVGTVSGGGLATTDSEGVFAEFDTYVQMPTDGGVSDPAYCVVDGVCPHVWLSRNGQGSATAGSEFPIPLKPFTTTLAGATQWDHTLAPGWHQGNWFRGQWRVERTPLPGVRSELHFRQQGQSTTTTLYSAEQSIGAGVFSSGFAAAPKRIGWTAAAQAGMVDVDIDNVHIMCKPCGGPPDEPEAAMTPPPMPLPRVSYKAKPAKGEQGGKGLAVRLKGGHRLEERGEDFVFEGETLRVVGLVSAGGGVTGALWTDYAIKTGKNLAREARFTEVVAHGDCGTQLFEIGQPTGILLPASVGGTGVEQGGAFACFDVKGAEKPDRGTQVRAGGLDGERLYDVVRLSRLCVPVDVESKVGLVEWPPGAAGGEAVLCARAKLARKEIAQDLCGPAKLGDRGQRLSRRQTRHERRAGLPLADSLGTIRVDSMKEVEVCRPMEIVCRDCAPASGFSSPVLPGPGMPPG